MLWTRSAARSPMLVVDASCLSTHWQILHGVDSFAGH